MPPCALVSARLRPYGLSTALAARVTLVTVNAVVDVPFHALMFAVGLRRRVAVRALEHRVIVRVRMTRRAHPVGVAVGNRELRVLRVIKRRTGPRRRVVAILARGREKLRLRRMPRVRRVVVIGLVAADACGRERCVVAVDVAVGALPRRYRVRPCQREWRVVVVKRRIRPHDRVMA